MMMKPTSRTPAAPRLGGLSGGGALMRAVLRTNRTVILSSGGAKALSIALVSLQPVIINRLLRFLQNPNRGSSGPGVGDAFLLLGAALLNALVENHYFLLTFRAGMRVRSGIQGMLYAKSLSMSPTARASATVGEVVNLMQLDAQRSADFAQFLHMLWGAPVQILVTVILLYVYIGKSAIFGLLITVMTIPLQAWLMSIAVKLRSKGIAIADKRVKLVNEILQGIKGVKFYAWERPFADQVTALRKEELKVFSGTIAVRSGFITIMMVIPNLIAVVTFAFFAGVFKQPLDPARVFSGIALLNQLRTPVMMFPMVITSYIDAKLAMKRIERFLHLEDTDDVSDTAGQSPGATNGSGPTKIVTTTNSMTSGTRDAISTSSSFSPTEESHPRIDGVKGYLADGTRGGQVSVVAGSFSWGAPAAPLHENDLKKPGIFTNCFPRLRGKGKTAPEDKVKEAHGPAVEGVATATSATAAQGVGPDVISPVPLNSPGRAHDADEMDVVPLDEGDTAVARPFLHDINLELAAGELTAIVGRVAAGKSSLICAILGEMKRLSGSVLVTGSVAYVSQTAWIFNDTLRNNILFGRPYSKRAYDRAVRVSALAADIDVLPDGDFTAIGEKGINLSGGQKQRVSIARAVYADADVYVFDDPLSALDSHVGQTVFDDCISNRGVLRDKLRLFVTNQLHVLPECDRIIFMERGIVKRVGAYESLMKDGDFRTLVDEVDKKQEVEDAPGAGAVDPLRESIDEAVPVDVLASSIRDVSKDERIKQDSESISKQAGDVDDKAGGKALMQSEERITGNVSLRSYYRYAIACGGVIIFALCMLVFIASAVASVLSNWWLVYWTDHTLLPNHQSLGFYLGMYFALGLLFALLTFGRSVWYLTLALRASEKLHVSMLDRVLRAPMSFFDTTPIGRIISRFSRDVNAVDQMLPQSFSQMLTTVLNLVASYVYIATVLPWFILIAAPITGIYYGLQRFYNRASIELKRLDSISKSPIYAHFSETLGGLPTIRAYRKQNDFREENMKMIDVNQRAYFQTIASNRWFSLSLEIFGSSLVFGTALLAVLTRGKGGATPAGIGLSLTYALQVTSILGFTIRSITDLEVQMNSVERMDYYGTRLPQEAPAKRGDGDGGVVVPKEWPQHGQIELREVALRYREELELVLKGISLKIGAGEKVGVVGRTGSGKSTLMIALLRLVELSAGSIEVDGVTLADVGLEDLRSKITIIPQDPVIFSGTVRFNLDPFGVYSEAELWDALAKSHLKEFVQDFEGGLDAKVSEYGENMSAGQRQLICLTRALLRRSKVLIMDEASSSLDYETDRLLQESIQRHMSDATILTIAHRLWTLTKCDKILVMKDGVVSEFDSPEALLARPDSDLRFLVDAMGEDGAARFQELVDEQARAAGRVLP